MRSQIRVEFGIFYLIDVAGKTVRREGNVLIYILFQASCKQAGIAPKIKMLRPWRGTFIVLR